MNNDDFIISTLDGKEESKNSFAKESMKPHIPSSMEASSKLSSTFNRDKRSGLRAAAGSMFSNQTGGKCTFTDYN